MWRAWVAIAIGVVTALVLAFYASRHPKNPDT